MRVSELKAFLKRHEVNANSIARSDGKEGPPRKSDLLAASLNLRADYDNPSDKGPTSPMGPRNIFQSGYSPTSSRNVTPTPSSTRVRTPARRRGSDALSQEMPSGGRSPKSDGRKVKPRRRSSVGWVNPAFLAQLTPKSSKVASASKQRDEVASNKNSEPEEIAETFDSHFGDEGDQIVISDYDSSSAVSGPESDTGSVVETDEEEDSSVNQFKLMKAYEVRAWLTEQGVKFNVRSKKAELISIATAHALYLENLASDSTPKQDGKPESISKQTTKTTPVASTSVEEIEKIQQTSVAQRASRPREPRRYSRNDVVEERPARVPEPVEPVTRRSKLDSIVPTAEIDLVVPQSQETVVANAKQSSSSRRRFIKAPQPDDEPNSESVPVAKKRHKRRHGRTASRTERRAQPKFQFPKFSMPKITITKRGIGVLLLVMATFAMGFAWKYYQRPFCDTNVNESCWPCPEHGTCNNGVLKCNERYKIWGKICVEDTEVNDYAMVLEKEIRYSLAELKGQQICGLAKDAAMTEHELFVSFEPNASQTRRRLSKYASSAKYAAKYDSAFKKAMQLIRGNDAIEIIESEVLGAVAYESKVGNIRISCRIKRFVRRNLQYLIPICLLLLMLVKLYIKRFFRKREEARVELVYQKALDVLRDVRVNFSDDDKGDAFMRDTELREELLGRKTSESVKFWAKVEKLLRSDTRVLHSGPRTIKGMPCYVYEWRGNLRRPSLGSVGRDGFRPYTGGSDSESRRRLSFGSGSRRQSPHYDPSSPMARRLSTSPTPVAPSPGYRRLLKFWNS